MRARDAEEPERDMPRWNGPVLTLLKIIKIVIYSVSKAELGAIFFTAQEMVAMRQTLQEMKWPQPKSPLQTEKNLPLQMW